MQIHKRRTRHRQDGVRPISNAATGKTETETSRFRFRRIERNVSVGPEANIRHVLQSVARQKGIFQR